MQFNKLINRYLKEEDEAPSREDRIKALSNLEDPEDRAQREREAEREAYKQYWQRREEQERQEGETRRQEAQRQARGARLDCAFPRASALWNRNCSGPI